MAKVGEILRASDACFPELPGYSFAPCWLEGTGARVGLRMHYLDEAPAGGADKTALCLHGQPTWSYIYRRMIPGLLAAGYRVVAPDLFGFGKSDKPVTDEVYTFDFHRASLLALVEALDLTRITLVCQDWGGILGLTLPMESPARFEALLVMNTMLATGDRPLTKGFLEWRLER